MPAECLDHWRGEAGHGCPDLPGRHGVVVLAVVDVGLQASAHGEAAALGQGDVAQVEEAVDVRAEQQAAGDVVRAARGASKKLMASALPAANSGPTTAPVIGGDVCRRAAR